MTTAAELAAYEAGLHSQRRRGSERISYDAYVKWILKEVSR